MTDQIIIDMRTLLKSFIEAQMERARHRPSYTNYAVKLIGKAKSLDEDLRLLIESDMRADKHYHG